MALFGYLFSFGADQFALFACGPARQSPHFRQPAAQKADRQVEADRDIPPDQPVDEEAPDAPSGRAEDGLAEQAAGPAGDRGGAEPAADPKGLEPAEPVHGGAARPPALPHSVPPKLPPRETDPMGGARSLMHLVFIGAGIFLGMFLSSIWEGFGPLDGFLQGLQSDNRLP